MALRRLILIRHAESTRNLVERGSARAREGFFFENDADRQRIGVMEDRHLPITENGWQQAIAAGNRLREFFGTFDLIVHSGYRRTKETLDGILRAYTAEEKPRMIIDESFLIRERDPGYCYNLTHEEVEKYFPWYKEYRRKSESFFMAPPGGESIADMCSGRLLTFLNELHQLTANIPEAKVLVVTHVQVLRGLRFLLEKWNYDEMNRQMQNNRIPNCSATSYRFDVYPQVELQFDNKVFS